MFCWPGRWALPKSHITRTTTRRSRPPPRSPSARPADMANYRMLVPLLVLLAALLPTTAQAEERILFYGSDIQVRPDASLEVTETIRVRAEGVAINHGIYREFPTRYSAGVGREMKVGFEVEEVK